MRICIVLSSGGSVLSKVLKNQLFLKHIYSIVTDRSCNAQNLSKQYNIKLKEVFEKDNLLFSDLLLKYCQDKKIDFILSFHIRLYIGDILRVYQNKIINFHLSLLPAFPGFNSFEKALIYGSKILGTTIHFINEKTDMGWPILQTLIQNDPNLTKSQLRHLLFIQQCKSLIQVTLWLSENRVIITSKGCLIKDASFNQTQFAPSLDHPAAINFKI